MAHFQILQQACDFVLRQICINDINVKYEETPKTSQEKKLLLCQIFRGKICILSNLKGKKSVFNDKICMSARFATGKNLLHIIYGDVNTTPIWNQQCRRKV